MAPDNDFEITIRTAPVGELDAFALSACQVCNFGNQNDWFGAFRGGLFGFDARIFGVKSHFRLVHSWLPAIRHPSETEHHAASLLFCMDSAMECFVFMLNALGYATMPAGFWGVADSNALKSVTPCDILGRPTDATPSPERPGYSAVFPNLQAHWLSNRDLVFTIMDLHDVSKHRQTIYTGGQLQQDPPKGFFESFGVQNDTIKQVLLSPHSEILVTTDPKGRNASPAPSTYQDRTVMEKIVEDFRSFIEHSCDLARDDARTNIRLPGGEPESSCEPVRAWLRDGDEIG
jgi:hypothetical protein